MKISGPGFPCHSAKSPEGIMSTSAVICGIEPKAGVHFTGVPFTKVTLSRSSPEFADFTLEIAAHDPGAETTDLIVDN
jgi:hypothetical protein